MNERIKELVREAYLIDNRKEFPDWEHNQLSEALIKDMNGVFEQFAELIIRECGDVALRMENHPLYEHHDCMLKHFGVE